MKKIILTIVVMICLISQIDAKIRFGIKGGINSDSPKVENASASFAQSTGWHAGAMVQIMLPTGLGVQPELLYTAKNMDIAGKKNGIGYFEIPVNLRYEINLVLVRPYFTFGPHFSRPLNVSKLLEPMVNKDEWDWGLGIGGGIEIWKLHTGLRYSWGMKDMGVSNFEMKNRTFMVSLGLLF